MSAQFGTRTYYIAATPTSATSLAGASSVATTWRRTRQGRGTAATSRCSRGSPSVCVPSAASSCQRSSAAIARSRETPPGCSFGLIHGNDGDVRFICCWTRVRFLACFCRARLFASGLEGKAVAAHRGPCSHNHHPTSVPEETSSLRRFGRPKRDRDSRFEVTVWKPSSSSSSSCATGSLATAAGLGAAVTSAGGGALFSFTGASAWEAFLVGVVSGDVGRESAPLLLSGSLSRRLLLRCWQETQRQIAEIIARLTRAPPPRPHREDRRHSWA